MVCALTVIAVLSVLTIFFFPSLEGPYSVVHGPVTALLSFRAATMLRKAIAGAGQSVRRSCKRMSAVLPGRPAKAISELKIPADVLSVSGSILRC